MFHPIGTQPPQVYWRRRLFLVGAVVLLIVLVALTANALGGGNGSASASGTSSRTPTAPASQSAASPSNSRAAQKSSGSTSKNSASGSSSVSPSQPIQQCSAKSLDVTAAVGQTSYKVGDHPSLEMQVTDLGSQPCVQDLADKQVELRVYNGESRVWGSHDCKVQPGTLDRTLTPRVPVKVAISWLALSSQPGCKGTRQQVGAGSYTLYALLGGRMGKAAQFSIS